MILVRENHQPRVQDDLRKTDEACQPWGNQHREQPSHTHGEQDVATTSDSACRRQRLEEGSDKTPGDVRQRKDHGPARAVDAPLERHEGRRQDDHGKDEENGHEKREPEPARHEDEDRLRVKEENGDGRRTAS